MNSEDEQQKEERLIRYQQKILEKIAVQQGYTLEKYISAGSFGSVFLLDKQGKKFVAKVGRGVSESGLFFESFVLKQLSRSRNPYIPRMQYFEASIEYNMLICEYKGISLQKYIENTGKIQEGFLWNISYQFLKAIKSYHLAGFMHRDLKPQNILLSYPDETDAANLLDHYQQIQLYLIDFGLSARHLQYNNVPYKDFSKKNFVGTIRYASIAAHNGIFQQPKDDIESFCYVLSYLLHNKLPWQNIGIDSKSNKYKVIAELKTQYTSNHLQIAKHLFLGANSIFVDLLMFTKQPNAFNNPNHYDGFIHKFQYLAKSFQHESSNSHSLLPGFAFSTSHFTNKDANTDEDPPYMNQLLPNVGKDSSICDDQDSSLDIIYAEWDLIPLDVPLP